MEINYFKIPEIKVTYSDKVRTTDRLQILNSNDLYKVFKLAFKDCMQHHEEAYVVYMNRAKRVMGISCISKCGIAGTVVDLRIIMQQALKANASCLAFCHNHPSSNLYPSQEDKELTKKLSAACKFLDINFVDHLIITEENYYSFANEGLII